LQGCARPLHQSERERYRDTEIQRYRDTEIQRERGREKERERGRERERERKKERGGDSEKEGGRERCIICPELLFLFLKGMMGALAPFGYLVSNKMGCPNKQLVSAHTTKSKARNTN
jgi:hypothetical protein